MFHVSCFIASFIASAATRSLATMTASFCSTAVFFFIFCTTNGWYITHFSSFVMNPHGLSSFWLYCFTPAFGKFICGFISSNKSITKYIMRRRRRITWRRITWKRDMLPI